ncbi:acyl-CoA dehydrogenase [Stenoxybacter acetivorans]|uniref:acyl-CoA dehydrogenase n=1 Tax=Stenoxybacter acetivorans TaxID=422441 RepID=UPI0005682AF2|nr:acyl-CoA dehydrogenase [Stenoxybacter acetivorans]
MTYRVPLNELRFSLQTHGRLPEILSLPNALGLDFDTVDAVLAEAAKFAENELAATNRTGDLNGAKLANGKVITHSDIATAYQRFCEAGWMGLRAPEAYGGQGLPASVAAACEEMWCSANLAFSLLSMLTLGAAEAIHNHANEQQKQTYLPKMSAGLWTGTMNLTEPQAGSDLSQINTKATPKDNGAYAVSGQKIFITWGEQELTENIVHLVLARLPDAPAGVKGISLFICPKYLLDEQGSTTNQKNTVSVVSLEHKMGIHASPTCVMQFEEAEAYLVGEANKGLAYMFTMMNHARLCVGIEGHAVAERAFQAAASYAKERVQGRGANGEKAVIIQHPDVRRMLAVQKAVLAAQRALYFQAAAAIDTARHHPNPQEQQRAQDELGFLIPIVKAWSTDNGTILTNTAMQVFGGMGYIEESGVAQYVRDVRITAIYEGTNGIQAQDLIGRKTAGNGGKAARALLAAGEALAAKLSGDAEDLAENLTQALRLAESGVDWVLNNTATQAQQVQAGANAYLQQMACTLGAIAMARHYLAAQEALADVDNAPFDEDFYHSQQHIVRVFFAQILPKIHTYAAQMQYGSKAILDLPAEAF